AAATSRDRALRARGVGPRVRRARAVESRNRAGAGVCRRIRRARVAIGRIQGGKRSPREGDASRGGRASAARRVRHDGVDRRGAGRERERPSSMMGTMPPRIATYRRLLLALGVTFALTELITWVALRGGPFSEESLAGLFYSPFFAPAVGGAFVIHAFAR